jgi:hypothetical protein
MLHFYKPMPTKQNLESILDRARISIENALNNPTVQNYLNDYGYGKEKLQAGRQLYQTALDLQQKQRREYGEQIEATSERDKLWDIAHSTYMRFVKIARVAYKNNSGIATQLGINGNRKESFSGWLLDANQFYINTLGNDRILKVLAEYGITPAKLESGKTEVQALSAANLVQEKEKGESQEATQKRDDALDALSDWMGDFVAIARIALETEAQLLESLGISEPS